MSKETKDINERERIKRMGAATDGGVKRGKETRQTTAGMVFRIETEEGNEYTYETGWQIGGTDREETPISSLHAEITAAEAAMYTIREIRKETNVEAEKIDYHGEKFE